MEKSYAYLYGYLLRSVDAYLEGRTTLDELRAAHARVLLEEGSAVEVELARTRANAGPLVPTQP